MFTALSAGLRTRSPAGLTETPSGLPRSNSSSVSTVHRTGVTAARSTTAAPHTSAAATTAPNRIRGLPLTSFLHVDGKEAVPLGGVAERDRLLGHAAIPHPEVVAAGLRPGHHLRHRRGEV